MDYSLASISNATPCNILGQPNQHVIELLPIRPCIVYRTVVHSPDFQTEEKMQCDCKGILFIPFNHGGSYAEVQCVACGETHIISPYFTGE